MALGCHVAMEEITTNFQNTKELTKGMMNVKMRESFNTSFSKQNATRPTTTEIVHIVISENTSTEEPSSIKEIQNHTDLIP